MYTNFIPIEFSKDLPGPPTEGPFDGSPRRTSNGIAAASTTTAARPMNTPRRRRSRVAGSTMVGVHGETDGGVGLEARSWGVGPEANPRSAPPSVQPSAPCAVETVGVSLAL